jgi:hypothetical protein
MPVSCRGGREHLLQISDEPILALGTPITDFSGLPMSSFPRRYCLLDVRAPSGLFSASKFLLGGTASEPRFLPRLK